MNVESGPGSRTSPEGASSTGPRWRRALAAAGHDSVCWKCRTPIPVGQESEHVHDGKYWGEKILKR